MADDRQAPDLGPGWDRIGRFMENIATTGQAMADRNLKLWREVAQNIRQRPYTADHLATDAANLLDAAMENIDAAWSFWARVPERQTVASPLPTAFLSFSAGESEGGYDVPDPVWIRTPIENDEVAQEAAVMFAESHPEGTAALRQCVHVEPDPANRAYLVYAADVQRASLVPGLYSGFVYVTKTPGATVVPLANLRVVVAPQRRVDV